MKLILRLLLLAALLWFVSPYLPWWWLLVASFICGALLPGNHFPVFISGFLAAGLVWMSAAWYLDWKNQSALSSRVVQLFPLDDPLQLVLITGLIGALGGGLGAVTGNSFRQIFMKKKTKSLYS